MRPQGGDEGLGGKHWATHETLSIPPPLVRRGLGGEAVRMGLERFAAVRGANVIAVVSSTPGERWVVNVHKGGLTPKRKNQCSVISSALSVAVRSHKNRVVLASARPQNEKAGRWRGANTTYLRERAHDGCSLLKEWRREEGGSSLNGEMPRTWRVVRWRKMNVTLAICCLSKVGNLPSMPLPVGCGGD